MPSCKGLSNSYKEESLVPKRFFAATDLTPCLLFAVGLLILAALRIPVLQQVFMPTGEND